MVDVCQLIQACTPQSGNDCYTMSGKNQAQTGNQASSTGLGTQEGIFQECTGGTMDWVLAICYQEQPARPIGALVGVNTPTCASASCGCGGSCTGGCGGSGSGCASCGSGCGGGGGCGCSGASAPMGSSTQASPGSSYATRPQGASKSISCEPTLTCEGYRFIVYPAPTSTQRGYGEAALQVLCCMRELLTNLYSARGAQLGTAAQSYAYLTGVKNLLSRFVSQGQFYDCALATRLAGITIQQPTGDALVEYRSNTLSSLADIGSALIQKCLCAALLPPCPGQAPTDCVPLATVTVTNGNCRVVSVCNIGARKFLVTIPNIAYWLSLFTTSVNGASPLQAALESLCCPAASPVYGRNAFVLDRAAGASPTAAAPPPAPAAVSETGQALLSERAMAAPGSSSASTPTPTPTPTSTIASAPAPTPAPTPAPSPSPGASQNPAPAGQIDLTKALATGMLSAAISTPERVVNAQTLFLGALGMKDGNGNPLISDTELSHPSDFLLLNQLVAPVFKQMFPDGLMSALAGGTGSAGSAPAAPSPSPSPSPSPAPSPPPAPPAGSSTPLVSGSPSEPAGPAIDVVVIMTQIEALKEQLDLHRKAIDQLKKRKG
jgi:hypothetical protein